MKKSTLLSLATAGAIVLTSAGTYAVWDVTSDTSTGSVTFRNPVSVQAANIDTMSTVTEIGNLPVYTGTAKFTVENAPAGYKFETKAVVKNGDAEVADNLVTTTLEDAATEVEGVHNVTVEIQPTSDDADAKALAGQALTVEVTGELVKDEAN